MSTAIASQVLFGVNSVLNKIGNRGDIKSIDSSNIIPILNEIIGTTLQCLGAIRLLNTLHVKDDAFAERSILMSTFKFAAYSMLDSMNSATRTHNKDYRECEDPLQMLVLQYPLPQEVLHASPRLPASKKQLYWLQLHWFIIGCSSQVLFTKYFAGGVPNPNSDLVPNIQMKYWECLQATTSQTESTLDRQGHSAVHYAIRWFPDIPIAFMESMLMQMKLESVATEKLSEEAISSPFSLPERSGEPSVGQLMHLASRYSKYGHFIDLIKKYFAKSVLEIDEGGNYPIHIAAFYSTNQSVMKHLLQVVKYPSLFLSRPNLIGRLPLHMAVSGNAIATSIRGMQQPNRSLFKELAPPTEQESVEIVRLLGSAYPVAFKTPDIFGFLPLHVAAYCNGSLRVTKYLLEECPAAAYYALRLSNLAIGPSTNVNASDIDDSSVIDDHDEFSPKRIERKISNGLNARSHHQASKILDWSTVIDADFQKTTSVLNIFGLFGTDNDTTKRTPFAVNDVSRNPATASTDSAEAAQSLDSQSNDTFGMSAISFGLTDVDQLFTSPTSKLKGDTRFHGDKRLESDMQEEPMGWNDYFSSLWKSQMAVGTRKQWSDTDEELDQLKAKGNGIAGSKILKSSAIPSPRLPPTDLAAQNSNYYSTEITKTASQNTRPKLAVVTSDATTAAAVKVPTPASSAGSNQSSTRPFFSQLPHTPRSTPSTPRTAAKDAEANANQILLMRHRRELLGVCDGMLPLHLACMHCHLSHNGSVAIAILNAHPLAAQAPDSRGYLPLHCLVDSTTFFTRSPSSMQFDGDYRWDFRCRLNCLYALLRVYPKAVFCPNQDTLSPYDIVFENYSSPLPNGQQGEAFADNLSDDMMLYMAQSGVNFCKLHDHQKGNGATDLANANDRQQFSEYEIVLRLMLMRDISNQDVTTKHSLNWKARRAAMYLYSKRTKFDEPFDIKRRLPTRPNSCFSSADNGSVVLYSLAAYTDLIRAIIELSNSEAILDQDESAGIYTSIWAKIIEYI